MTCKHQNLEITETGYWTTTHFYRVGKIDDHDNEPGDYAFCFDVECPDCGRRWKISRNHIPKWLLPYTTQLNWGGGSKGKA